MAALGRDAQASGRGDRNGPSVPRHLRLAQRRATLLGQVAAIQAEIDAIDDGRDAGAGGSEVRQPPEIPIVLLGPGGDFTRGIGHHVDVTA